MDVTIREVSYFYVTVEDRTETAYELLADLALAEINLLAFSAIRIGPHHAQLTIFPDRSENMVRAAESLGLPLLGPQHALLVQGDDHLGALASVHRKLAEKGVEVYASSGVTDGQGRFGYVIYVKEEHHQVAAWALGVEGED